MDDYSDFSFLPEKINRYVLEPNTPRPLFPELKPWETVAPLESIGWEFFRHVSPTHARRTALYGRSPDGVWFEYHGDFMVWVAFGYE